MGWYQRRVHGRRVVQSRRMKLLCSVLLGTVFGQYEDCGAYGYSQYSAYEYDQYGNKKNKKNQYVAPSYNEGYNSYGKQYGEDEINLGRFNGLHCWSCDARVSVQALAAGEYKYEKLTAFMKLSLNSLAVDGSTLVTGKYPMPVEGRNSITEGKVDRAQNSWEESDQLSRETLDHFDIRMGGK